MTLNQILDEQMKEFDELFTQDNGPFPDIPMPTILKKDVKFSGRKVKIKGQEGDFVVDGWNSASIEDVKSFIHSYTRKLIESLAEEIINLTPKYGDEYEIEAFREEQRLKVKEIISKLEK